MPGRAASSAPSRQRSRAARPSGTSTPSQTPAPAANQQLSLAPAVSQTPSQTTVAPSLRPAQSSHPARPPIPTSQQALQTTYSSRLRTGATLLMQPILTTPATAATGTRTGTRRGGVINYADPGSGDELDAGGPDTDDSDFVASGGTRTAIRQSRGSRPFINNTFTSFQTPQNFSSSHKQELDQSYLGMIPPPRYITAKKAEPTKHDYP